MLSNSNLYSLNSCESQQVQINLFFDRNAARYDISDEYPDFGFCKVQIYMSVNQENPRY